MDRQESQSNWQEIAKNPGITRVLERCAPHQEQESQALERRRRRRMEIGKSASTADLNQQKNADRDLLPI